MLSDETLRANYDANGKEGVEAAPKVDPATLFAMIFGSEKFVPLVGECESGVFCVAGCARRTTRICSVLDSGVSVLDTFVWRETDGSSTALRRFRLWAASFKPSETCLAP